MSRLPFFYSSPLKRFFFLVVLLCVLGNLPLYTYNFSTFNCVTHSHIPVERSSLSELLLSTSNLSTCLLYTGRMLIFHQRKTCFSINKLNKKNPHTFKKDLIVPRQSFQLHKVNINNRKGLEFNRNTRANKTLCCCCS